MLDSYKEVNKYLKIGRDKASIDDVIFKLHYRATVALLVLCTILVTQRQYIGEHIKCITDQGVPEKVINTYCFFSTTFTVSKHYDEAALAAGNVPHPGVGTYDSDDDETIHHTYYQWVPFLLFGQAIMFYFPHYIWKIKEDGRLQALVKGFRLTYLHYDEDKECGKDTVLSMEHLERRIDSIKFEFCKRLRLTRTWSFWLVFCETLNLLNLLLQIYITDLFLGGNFLTLGPTFCSFTNWDAYMDPLDVIFPKVTKCTFYKFGPSGSIQYHDTLCVMALNVIHEKIYTILWFWYAIVLIFTTLGLLNRVLIFVFHSRSTRYNEFMFSYACPGYLDIRNMITVTHECYFGDWLFIYFMARNMNPFTFKLFLKSLASELQEKRIRKAAKKKTNSNNMNQRSKSNDGEIFVDSE